MSDGRTPALRNEELDARPADARALFLWTCGRLPVPAFAFAPSPLGALWERGEITTAVAVLVAADGAVTLIDCGYARATCEDPLRRLGPIQAALLGLTPRAAVPIVTQLAARGIPASAVRTIVATHMHLDHVGALEDFPDAELVVEAREWGAFTAGANPGYEAATRALLAAARDRVRVIDAPAWDGSPAALADGFDVHGDGRVRLSALPGHTAGSTVAYLDDRLVHAGDAAFRAWEIAESRPCLYGALTAHDRAGYRAGLAALRRCADGGVPVVTSHDPRDFDPWAELA